MHATEKLDKEVTLTMPVKFVSAIVKALEDAAVFNMMAIKVDDDMDQQELFTRMACIECFKQVHGCMNEVMERELSADDIEVLQKVAMATMVAATEEKGVVN
jgi:predicted metal-dependent hydrolase